MVLRDPEGTVVCSDRGVRKAFTEEVTFDLSFGGCIGVHQLEKGRARILERGEAQGHGGLRGHVGFGESGIQHG